MGKVVDVLKAILTRLIFAGHGFIGEYNHRESFLNQILRRDFCSLFLLRSQQYGE